MIGYKLLLFSTFLLVTVGGGQPSWSTMYEGNNIYAFTTETWEECGLLCTRNFQRTEPGLIRTNCTAWYWNDPSNRHYANLCRFFEGEHYEQDNGQAISGLSGCYSLSTCWACLFVFLSICRKSSLYVPIIRNA